MFDAVIFDFDGTVADTGEGVRNGVRYALKQFNMDVIESRINEFLGPPLYLTFEDQYGVTPEFASTLVDTYRIYYTEKGVYELELYPGMLDLLETLRAGGVKIAVASSKPQHYLDVAIPYLGIDKYFDAVIGPELKNHNSDKSRLVLSACEALGVEPSKRVVMIGDRFYDIDGAKKAGVASAAFLSGYGSKEELEAHAPDIIAEDAAALKKALTTNTL